ARYQDMETSRLHDNIVLVVPHTAGIEVVMGDYSRWVSAGRPEGRDVVSQLAEGVPMWDPDAPPDPVRYLRLVPVEANFKVTGVIQDARPRNPGDIEAARSLLASRYDLKIGFWDLVSNPLLRQTLLDKMPEKPAPEIQAVVPLIASARASKAVAKRVDERMAEKQALAAVTEEMECIESIGWARSKARSDGFQLASFALTEPMQRWETQPASPLVSLGLTVNRRSCSIAMHTTMYNDVSVPTYMSTRKERFEQIALQSLPRLGQIAPVLWSLSGGWGDSVDWRQRCEKIAVMTPQWVDALADLVTECRAKHTDKRSFWERQSDARP
ncbi:MAG TPA: hypothetical protein VFB34_08790, partial [Chloroflexota bacterium]|nr:hypothetical protein [Chloroflexota bacterium]